MTNFWHPSDQPHTSHNAPKYWANVADLVDSSHIRPHKVSQRSQPDLSQLETLPTQPPISVTVFGDTSDATSF